MKFTLPREALPGVTLTKEQHVAFIEEAETVVRETLAANEEFLAGGATFRDPKWKLVRTKEGLNVYCERRSSRSSKESAKVQRPSPHHSQNSSWSFKRRGSDTPWPSSGDGEASLSGDTIQERMKRPGVSMLILFGTIDGNLGDCMLGTFVPTNQAWIWRSSHIKDHFDDARILANIRGPTKKDPFRFLNIKWFAKEIPAVLSGIVQQRDYILLEASGLTQDSRGDTIGYYILHSVELPGFPEFTDQGIIRGQLSLCFIDRQCGSGKVELYCRSFSDPAGDMIDRVNTSIFADSILSAAGVIDYAYIKKLTWLMKQKGVLEQNAARRDEDHRPTRCEGCEKNFTKFALAGVGPGAPCHLCQRVMCGKCSVVKKMTVDVTETGSVKRCALRFCLNCLLKAKEHSVWEVALSAVETSSECSSISDSGRLPFV
ncbi:tRNA (guanine(26)-N(2))-dimethyltransferase [Phytophthora cinnamomi]|uniref:tRNA (guanine(26)-N(2))-dimethyltransferase n=1 Tax=Phytophthora cinnamomi TaxID=4785 RepID=UPI00355AB494|nr:tRNA (guanine(26)-N(2))-dimethyltransferase [Phytophthora cinnamomi]